MINGTQLILNKVYDAVGFDAISDDVLRNLVIARICQPGSKMATSAYLKAYFKEDLNHWRIYRYMDKLYNTQQETAEARRLPGQWPGVSIMPPVPSSYREKKKENDSKNRSLPHLGCDIVPFSNRFIEDLNKIWELRHSIPDPTNPYSAKI